MLSLADRSDLIGFFSYSRGDDDLSEGGLSRLRSKIYSELRIQLGVNLRLWQDTVAIPEGAEWEAEIKKAISESVFFIPIVTPNSVASIHCRMEFEAFLAREHELGRKNLVFPLLYVRVPALENDEQWRQNPLLDIIGRRQYFDWQKFRHRSFTDAEIAERIEQFCRNIVESLQQPWVSPAERRDAEQREAQRVAEQARRDREEQDRQQAAAEALQQAAQARRAAEEAKTHRVAEQARRDREEKQKAAPQRRAQAETRRSADQERWDPAPYDPARYDDILYGQLDQTLEEDEAAHYRRRVAGELQKLQGPSLIYRIAILIGVLLFGAFWIVEFYSYLRR